MTIVNMNKRDREFCENYTWVVDGRLVYEGDINGNYNEHTVPYNLSNVFTNETVSEQEIAQYLQYYGFPWIANFE